MPASTSRCAAASLASAILFGTPLGTLVGGTGCSCPPSPPPATTTAGPASPPEAAASPEIAASTVAQLGRDLPILQELPADAALLAHVDLRRLFASPLWRENNHLMREDPEAQRTLESLATCGIELESLVAVDLAVDSAGRRVIVRLEGPAIGRRERLECIGDRLFAGDRARWALEPEPAAAAASAPHPLLRLDDGAAIAYAITEDRLLFTSKAWEPALRERLAGGGSSPATGALAGVLAGLDPTPPIWFAGRLPALTDQTEHLRSLRGAIDLAEGLALELAMVAANPELAAAIEGELQRRLTNLRGRLAAARLPEAALARITIAREASTLRIELSLTTAELRALRALLADTATAASPARAASPATDRPPEFPPPPGESPLVGDPAGE